MKVKSESEVAQSCPTFSDPMDCSLPGSSIHGFSRQEYWSGVPLPSVVKINKTKSWLFEKINKIETPLTRLIKSKREKNQINKIRNEKGQVTTVNEEIQRTLREYYEQLYGNKMDNLEEIDRFLEKFSLPRWNPEEIEIMNKPNTSTEIETVIKNLPQNKSLGPDGFTGKFYQTFREELTHILLKLFQKVAEG